MAYTTIDKSTDYFNTKLYTGTGASSQAQTGVGFKPDFVWIKSRSSSEGHVFTDIVRGVTKYLISNTTSAQVTNTDTLKSFDSDGYTIGPAGVTGGNGVTFASMNWKAGTTGSGTTGGSGTGKPYSYSVNTTSGFSIVTYTGNGSAGHTIPHGLGVAPKFIIVKSYSDTYNWTVYYGDPTDYLVLNATDTTTDSVEVWNDTAPSSTVFTVGNRNSTNQNSSTFVAYCFSEIQGFSKIGSYQGNANANGSFIYTGFRPAFLVVKNTELADNWSMFNSKALGYNTYNHIMYPDLANTESNGLPIDFLANGFKWRTAAGMANGNNQKLIYMAFAANPFVTSTGVPTTAN